MGLNRVDTGGPSAVILDPYRPYAHMLIQRLYENHGVRTVCLHSRWRERLLLEGRYPVLRSPAVSAHYMVPGHRWAAVCRILTERHKVVGVLPYEEGMVYPLAVLAQTLGLSWAQPHVLPAFRNKFALKSLVARADPRVRLNTFARVNHADEVLHLVRDRGISRYVLKPNSGSGNQQVAFFEDGSPREDLDAYFAAAGDQVLFEEFIAGDEFWVNGQMDAEGQPTVVGIGQYYRTHHEGVPNLEIGTCSLAPSDPRFQTLSTYARAVMRATGLRRSPFHLEAIIDDRGPCLIEVGARFCGELGALIDMAHHGSQLDLIDIAARYYVSDSPQGALPLDWDRVARTWVGTATGTSSADQRLVRVDGVREVERRPDFLFWIKRPEPGDYVQMTRSLTTRPWAVAMQGPHGTDERARIDQVRATIRLSGRADRDSSWRHTWPMYRGILNKLRTSRPRGYHLGQALRLPQ